MSLLQAIDEKAFLGTEFLTWLWFRSETGGASFALPDLGQFEIILDNAALLRAESESDVDSALFKGEAPGASYLMKKAVAEGKKIRRATFRVVWENIAWTASVNGETLDVSGIKLPVAAPKSGGGGSMHEHWKLRLETLEGFLDLWDELFRYFLAIRLDIDSWTDERDNIAEWLMEELAGE